MKVYLLNPYFIERYSRTARGATLTVSGSIWYPIFLAYAAAFLEKHGQAVKLVDAQASGLSEEEIINQVKEFRPQITVIYFSWPSIDFDIDIAKKIKEVTNSLIIFTSPFCSMDTNEILRKGGGVVDVVIHQEAELPLLNLANRKEFEQIKGISYQLKGKIFTNPSEEFLTEQQLTDMPFVSNIYKKFLDIDKYYQSSLKHPYVDLFTGRGCAWGLCSFCLWPHTIYQGAPKYRKRNINKVIEELKFIKKELPQVKEVFFQDDTMPEDRAREISEAILENKIKITWSCYAKPIFKYETLKLMKKAGCRCLHVGYESADLNILKLAKKGQTPQQMIDFTKTARKVGLVIHADFLLGLPGETEQTIKKTIKFARELKLLDYQFLIIQPMGKTPLYAYLKQHNYFDKRGEVIHPFKYEELIQWRFRAYKGVYLNLGYLLRSLKRPKELIRLIYMGFKTLPSFFGKQKSKEAHHEKIFTQ